jgi:hypothetical protein
MDRMAVTQRLHRSCKSCSSCPSLPVMQPSAHISPIDNLQFGHPFEICVTADESQAVHEGGGGDLAIGKGDAVSLGFHGRSEDPGLLGGFGLKRQLGDPAQEEAMGSRL